VRKVIDETGKRYGRLFVLRRFEKPSTNRAYWLCRCHCGVEKSVLGDHLRSGEVVSCGCYMREARNKRIVLTGKAGRPAKNEIGRRYGRLLVIERQQRGPGLRRHTRWICRCDCGTETVALGLDLRFGKHQSCGCGRGRFNGRFVSLGLSS